MPDHTLRKTFYGIKDISDPTFPGSLALSALNMRIQGQMDKAQREAFLSDVDCTYLIRIRQGDRQISYSVDLRDEGKVVEGKQKDLDYYEVIDTTDEELLRLAHQEETFEDFKGRFIDTWGEVIDLGVNLWNLDWRSLKNYDRREKFYEIIWDTMAAFSDHGAFRHNH